MKRCFDVMCAGIGLVLLAPLFLILAVIIELDSRGGVFFRQQRSGRNFVPFEIWKFRTMSASPAGGGLTIGEDPRITKAGRWLRRFKLDELPQLINVFRGEMSLVGPRPELPEFTKLFEEDYKTILKVRPGITDPASIKYRHESELLADAMDPTRTYVEEILPDKIKLAKAYAEKATLLADVRIILDTFRILTSTRRVSPEQRRAN